MATLQPEPLPTATVDPGTTLFLHLKKKHGLYSGTEVGKVVRTLPSSGHIVEGLIPPRSVNLLVGDSGVGKTPPAYQLALAVAVQNALLMTTRANAGRRESPGLQVSPGTLVS